MMFALNRTTMASCALAAISLTVILTMPPYSADAADAKGKYAVRGIGSSRCEQLVSAIDSKDANMRKDAVLLYTSWLNGYMSYVNRTEKETYDVVPLADGTQLLAVIAGQCRANPDSLMETVSAQVIGAMSKAKVKDESPLTEVDANGKKGSLRDAIIVAVQNKLIAQGYLKGKADGKFGSSSQNALIDFQKSEKLEITGFPDTNTLIRILLK